MYINDSIEIVEAPISADDYLRLVEDVGWKRFVNPGPLSVPFGIQFAFVGVESETLPPGTSTNCSIPMARCRAFLEEALAGTSRTIEAVRRLFLAWEGEHGQTS